MKYLYKLTHEQPETKLIGFYSEREKAEETIIRYKKIAGFKDYPDGFLIEKLQMDEEEMRESAVDSVFYLQHYYEEGKNEYVTEVGAYFTMEKAKKALIQSSTYEKFIHHPNDFIIDEYYIDQDEWEEGFFVYSY